MLRYRVLAHTADIGIAAAGATQEEAFENAAFAMFDLMFDLSGVEVSSGAQPPDECRVEAEADTPEELLVAWLSLLLAEAEIRGLALCRFRVEDLGGGRVAGTAGGVPSEGMVLRGPPIKAVTYHEAAVVETPTGWEARVIFDV
ncbi:MAG: archease [Actinobacteria bacterium]|nr:archease [Actinomycetota bacterium]